MKKLTEKLTEIMINLLSVIAIYGIVFYILFKLIKSSHVGVSK